MAALQSLHSILLASSCALQVRREAARCLGLYCLLDGIPPPAGHLTQLRLLLITPGESSAVRAVAAQVGIMSCCVHQVQGGPG